MKTNKSRLLALVLTLLMVVSLTACTIPFELPFELPFDIPGINFGTEPTEEPTIPEVNYTINYYYESTELGTYDAPVSATKKALQGTKVTAPDAAKTGFAINAETSVQVIDLVTEGATMNVYYDRVRVDVKFDYISKEDVTYKAAYGVGLIDAEGVQLTDSLVLLPAEAYLNGTKTELTADSFKALTKNAMVTFEPVAGDWIYEDGYAPANTEASYLYAPAVVGNQSFSATINLSTMENAISGTGIAIKTGEEVAVLYITGSGKNLNLIFGELDGSVTGLLSEEATTFVDGACKITATIYDGMLYVSINDVDCGYVALSSALPSYTNESEVAIGLYGSNASSGLATFTDVAVSTTVEPVTSTAARWEEKITFVPEVALGVKVDFINATIASIPGKLNRITLNGASKTWELSGTAERLTDDLKAEDFCIGFMIESDGKTLRMSATREGLVFEAHDGGHGRYAYHAFGTSQYNLNTKTGAFAFGEKRTQSKMHFKVQIIDDVFYAYFWFDGEEPTLCWYVPLTEKLIGSPTAADPVWKDSPFAGFAAGSEYKLHFFNNTTSTPGQFTNLVVKTGESVDTTQVPAYVAGVTSGTVDATTGNIISEPAQITNINFAGASNTIEFSGEMDRTETSTVSFMFNLYSGNKSLNITAATNGIVFGEDGTANGYTREPYHCFGPTQYNLRPINEFLTAKTTKMYFKVIIADDTFYAWFWYEGEEPTLAWNIPLAEQLYGPNGGAWNGGSPFMGFDSGSAFVMNFRVRAGGGLTLSNLSVKTGADVDTSVIPTPEA